MQRPDSPPQPKEGESHQQPFIKEQFVPLNPPNTEERIEGEDEGWGEEDVLGEGDEDQAIKDGVEGFQKIIILENQINRKEEL